MAGRSDDTLPSGALWLSQTSRLFKPEKIALLFFVGVVVAFDLIRIASTPADFTVRTAISLAITLAMAFYAWSPRVATLVIGAVVVIAFAAGAPGGALMGAAVAALLVTRLGTTPLFLSYVAGLLLAAVLVVSREDVSEATVAIFLAVAVGGGAIGVGLRYLTERGHRLERDLTLQAERQREALAEERHWFASELHDSIAHHLTIVSLHSQLLDDEEARESSQEAIQEAARQALTDLRFIINYSEGFSEEPVCVGDLSEAIEGAVKEMEAAGHPTVLIGDAEAKQIPRGADIVLARMVREASTNVVKYAGAGPVRIILEVEPSFISLEVRSPVSDGEPRVASSTGTGISRMSERALSLRGQFRAGPIGNGEWSVFTRLPIASDGIVKEDGTARTTRRTLR